MGVEHVIRAGVWCCSSGYRCRWQGYTLHKGLAWGTMPQPTDAWRMRHALECGGMLVQLLEPQPFLEPQPSESEEE